MPMKIATLNLCLGLPNKKEIIKQTIINEKIDVLCLQETEVEINLDHNLLSFPGYRYESENNSVCSRVGIYVKTNVSYVRRKDLEGVNSHITIIDLKSKNDYRIINLYRSFNPRNDYTPLELFKYQVNIIKNCLTDRTIILGDFNLDWNKRGSMNYPFRNYFNHWNDEMSGALAIQIVDFPTWSRSVNGILRESVIDHIYVPDPSAISELKGTK
jgi:exonuclease III